MSRDLSGLPNSRTSVRGVTPDGEEAWLSRVIARKLYRCPLCHDAIPIGEEHVLVRIVRPVDRGHHHWHRRCVEEGLIGELRSVRTVPASEGSRGALDRRARRRSRRGGRR